MSLRALYDVPAPGKLNLFLHVVGRRADGYHLLQSLFVPIDWADRLHFERRDDGRLARHDLGAALPADDLSLRAARALQQASGQRLGVDITLDKRLPWGAGLGGGSSDAASTLLALNRLWGLRWPRARLAAIGLALGADVPFFLGPGPAFVEGIGERLTPVALAGAQYLVVKPAAAVATRDVFAHPLARRDSEPDILAGSFEDSAACRSGYGRNDLQPAAEALCPEVAEAVRWLVAHLGNGRMSGSGSAVFARVDTECDTNDAAASPAAMPVAQALDELRRLRPQWVARHCRSLAGHPLAHW
ncbi:MAG: 4-(cytidine 5'-diphospho)-2-C-methyl-D-erythritol kinase [Proteobacteria bacterium]|nr:4-(cytidine 5'-diphospho)-2-C-methyl-D-erythritol kinase [Pseudomonadota bacterium]